MRDASQALTKQNPWTQPLMAILRFFAGVMEHLDQAQAKGFLVHVLNPIHRITDESGDLASAQGEGIGMSTPTSVPRLPLLLPY